MCGCVWLQVELQKLERRGWSGSVPTTVCTGPQKIQNQKKGEEVRKYKI